MKHWFISEHVFFYFTGGQIVVSNYATNEEYDLEPEYLQALLDISRTGHCDDQDICGELSAGNLITDRKPAPAKWGGDLISKIFHVGTQVPYPPVERGEAFEAWVTDLARLQSQKAPARFSQRDGPTVRLPAPDLDGVRNATVESVLKNRKTSRDFNAEPITLQTLSDLLHSSFGLIHGDSRPEYQARALKEQSARRAYASGGNVHAEEVYLVAYRVEGLTPGLYHYQPRDHQLTELRQGDFEAEILHLNGSQYFSEGLAAGIYLAARLERYWHKYPGFSRAYRGLLMDMGHASQTFQLVAAALGLSTWLTAAFEETAVNAFLELGKYESTFLFLGCGHGSGKVYSDTYLDAVKERLSQT